MNDKRAAIKRQINIVYQPEIVEEKSYRNARTQQAGRGSGRVLSEDISAAV